VLFRKIDTDSDQNDTKVLMFFGGGGLLALVGERKYDTDEYIKNLLSHFRSGMHRKVGKHSCSHMKELEEKADEKEIIAIAAQLSFLEFADQLHKPPFSPMSNLSTSCYVA